MPEQPSRRVLEPIVVDAAWRHGREGSFDWLDFAAAMKHAFGLRCRPDREWCRAVLARLDWIDSGTDGTWTYRGYLDA